MELVNIIKDAQPQCNVQHDYKFPTGQPAGVFGPRPFAIVEGAYLYDENGTVYLDTRNVSGRNHSTPFIHSTASN